MRYLFLKACSMLIRGVKNILWSFAWKFITWFSIFSHLLSRILLVKYFNGKIGKLVSINFSFMHAILNHKTAFPSTWQRIKCSLVPRIVPRKHRIKKLYMELYIEISKRFSYIVCVTERKDGENFLAKDQEMSLDYYVGNDDKEPPHCLIPRSVHIMYILTSCT